MISHKALPLAPDRVPSTLQRLCSEADGLNDPQDARVSRQLFAGGASDHRCHGGLRTRGQFKNPDTARPLVSIITIVFNGAAYLEDTILSVLALQDDHIEYIIVDGGSTDGTLDIIRRYEDRIDYWRSEPDQGIADAFNQGLALTRGDWIGFINADDWYEETAIRCLRGAMTGADIVTGTLRCHYADHVLKLPARCRWLRAGMFINHPCCFVSTKVYLEVGGFDTSFRLAMDYDFLVRASVAGFHLRGLPDTLANMRMIGISYRLRKQGRKEVHRIKQRFYGFNLVDWFFFMQIRVANNLRNKVAMLLRLTR